MNSDNSALGGVTLDYGPASAGQASLLRPSVPPSLAPQAPPRPTSRLRAPSLFAGGSSSLGLLAFSQPGAVS